MASDHKSAQLIIGRLFRMAGRPEQEGDVAEYQRLRGLLFDIGPATQVSGLAYMDAPDYAKDYRAVSA